jgi:site-specific recombinase XerD
VTTTALAHVAHSTPELIRGDLVPRRRRPATLAECVEPFISWFREVRGRSALTAASYEYDLRSFLAYATPRRLVMPDDVRHQDLEDYVRTASRARGLKPQTVNRHLSAFRSWWVYLLREELATRNPAAIAFGPKAPRRRIPPFIAGEAYDLVLSTLGQARTLVARRDFAIVGTLLLAGLRIFELVALRLVDVDLTEGQLYVAHGKGDHDRYVTAPPRLCGILGDYLANVRALLLGEASSPWVFVHVSPTHHHRSGWAMRNAGKPLLTRSVYARVVQQVPPIVGKHVWPHLCRHSYAVRLRSRGADLMDIKEELGHRQLETTAIYANIPSSERRAKIGRLLG